MILNGKPIYKRYRMEYLLAYGKGTEITGKMIFNKVNLTVFDYFCLTFQLDIELYKIKKLTDFWGIKLSDFIIDDDDIVYKL